MPLTDLAVRKLRPKEKRYEVLDVNGLVLRVLPTGKKVWSYRYMIDGKPKRFTLGYYPSLSLAEAREKHALALQDVGKKIDPEAKAQEEKAKRKASPTFQDLFDEFWERELQHSPTAAERRRLVIKDALPAWAARKVSSIKRRDAVLLIDEVRQRAPITANRLQGILVRMFNFASERGIIDISPLTGMRRGKESSRSRTLTDDEIKILWDCLDLENQHIDMYHLNKLALKAVLLSAQRPGEVVGMQWDHIEGEWWVIPAALRKTREENRVPILPMLGVVIEQAKAISGDSPYVFLSPRERNGGIRPLRVGSLANAIRRHRQEMGISEQFTPHDLRRTMRTRLAEIGVSDMVAEKILGHKLQGVLGIYNRHSYDAEKKQALALWEQKLSQIIGISEATSNVIPFITSHNK